MLQWRVVVGVSASIRRGGEGGRGIDGPDCGLPKRLTFKDQ